MGESDKQANEISIHALRKESDVPMLVHLSERDLISIHALRKESDKSDLRLASHVIFQSTLSVRRATGLFFLFQLFKRFQSTLSVRRATNIAYRCLSCIHISIHALRKESDTPHHVSLIQQPVFQSTLSVRRATTIYSQRHTQQLISIHALRKESDSCSALPRVRK